MYKIKLFPLNNIKIMLCQGGKNYFYVMIHRYFNSNKNLLYLSMESNFDQSSPKSNYPIREGIMLDMY